MANRGNGMEFDTQLLDISRHALEDETAAVAALLAQSTEIERRDASIRRRAHGLIASQRERGHNNTIEAFLQSYGLSTREGIAMLCLAEALLRIPDAPTADALIEDTFTTGNWKQHLGSSDSTLVNASTWALMLTGEVLTLDAGDSLVSWFGGLIKRSGEPVIRQALRSGMKFLGNQFVMGETIRDAMKNAEEEEKKGYTMSYDILGEGARTDKQAQGYIEAYMMAIRQIAEGRKGTLFEKPGISVKLSALHPRYMATQSDRVFAELLPRVKNILREAMRYDVAVSFDAEEANRLDLSLEIYRDLLTDPEFQGFDGIGWVMQAYQKRAIHVASALVALAREIGRRIPVRLVKGAYWDSEIKQAQVMGLEGYPVFTRKTYTDLSYLVCAQELLRAPENIYPQFATHNALTAATILDLAEANGRDATSFEFQRLHGMGESLHDQLLQHHRCRVYAPVGEHKDLLAYLIRRMLENGANTSFVHLLLDRATPIEQLTQSPITQARAFEAKPNPAIPLPADIYGPTRKNSQGFDLGYRFQRDMLQQEIGVALKNYPKAPAKLDAAQMTRALGLAEKAAPGWDKTSVAERAAILRRAADLLEEKRAEFFALAITEGKKNYNDAVAELREAVDFCRYYAEQAERQFTPILLPGPTGERNSLSLHGRGTFLCISPWNFPLAIFLGQVTAALAAGNAVLAKPAEQTPRIAQAAIDVLHEAGVPENVAQLIHGSGRTVGEALVADPRIAGVCFTGSTAVAHTIQRTLATKGGPIVPFIAETGGLNVMIVDSSALLEQAVDDIITSAFGSAGQRCSAARAVLVQQDVAPALRELLTGAMDELCVGAAWDMRTDVPPVIDAHAREGLLAHAGAMKRTARWWHATKVADDLMNQDSYVPPHVFGLDDLSQLTEEQFGPILHFFTYKAKELPQVIDSIHKTGYGLTFGLHTRLRSTMDTVLGAIHVGNRYVNRSMIGAVVGVQPFGGEGLSGTGPKAGGPHYLLRFAAERTTTINTAAIGGNIELLS
jgi:RHH-type proline utilization regulon transcriptional repressor/proline dehydrogenase/delta 1-pyrroline-5-carboxylate dehydrogenase